MHYGIPKTLVGAIKTLYINSKSAVYVDGHPSKEFEVTTVVLQGDVLAPASMVHRKGCETAHWPRLVSILEAREAVAIQNYPNRA